MGSTNSSSSFRRYQGLPRRLRAAAVDRPLPPPPLPGRSPPDPPPDPPPGPRPPPRARSGRELRAVPARDGEGRADRVPGAASTPARPVAPPVATARAGRVRVGRVWLADRGCGSGTTRNLRGGGAPAAGDRSAAPRDDDLGGRGAERRGPVGWSVGVVAARSLVPPRVPPCPRPRVVGRGRRPSPVAVRPRWGSLAGARSARDGLGGGSGSGSMTPQSATRAAVTASPPPPGDPDPAARALSGPSRRPHTPPAQPACARPSR